MKHFLLLFLFLFISSGSYAQKLYRQYTFHQQAEGSVYFIYPQKGFKSNSKESVKDLEYDITYSTPNDSASFTLSWYTLQVVQAKTVRIQDQTGNIIYESGMEMLFTQPKKKYWQQRGQFCIPYEILTELYNQPTPFTITLIGNKELEYKLPQGKWQKQSALVNKIFEVIKYNR